MDGENTLTAPKREKPPIQAVQTLMQMYPRLDSLMAETVLSFSEQELGEFLEKKYDVDCIDDNKVSEIESKRVC
jgi:hypothetical protein